MMDEIPLLHPSIQIHLLTPHDNKQEIKITTLLES